MKTIGRKLQAFAVTGVRTGFQLHEENGDSAFELLAEASSPIPPARWSISSACAMPRPAWHCARPSSSIRAT